jgi:hypothetical protein
VAADKDAHFDRVRENTLAYKLCLRCVFLRVPFDFKGFSRLRLKLTEHNIQGIHIDDCL